jgi:hypothetical protein
MTDKKFENIIELVYMGGGFLPANQRANELTENCVKGEILSFLEVTERDLKFHKCYFSLLGYIYDYLPMSFTSKVSKDNFHKFLKHLQGKYKVLFTFKDGTVMVEYESISFGNMSQKRFEEYVKEQLPYIYENVIGAFFEGEMYDNIIATIEEEYEKFLVKLH